MQPQKIFKEKLKGNFGRKVFSSPYTYRLARELFLRGGNFNFEAKKKLMDMALQQAAEAYQGQRPVVWTSAFFPGELLYFFDLVPFAPEVASATAASLELAPYLLRHADELGLSSDSCSFHRCAAAGTSQEYFPLPDFLAASSHLCDGAPRLFQYMARRYRSPLYLLDVPVRTDEEAEHYVARQLEGMVRNLESQQGKKLTAEKIEEVFHYANQAREYQLEVARLRQQVPCPLNGEEGLGFVYLLLMGEGHPRTPEIYRTLVQELQQQRKNNHLTGASKEEAARRVERGIEGSLEGSLEGNLEGSLNGNLKDGAAEEEAYRLIWMHLRPYHSADMIQYLEQELKMKIVMEEMNLVYWPPLDPSQPFLSLARKVLSHPGLGPIRRRLDAVEKMVEDHRAHGVVHFSHWGCRQAVGGTMYLRKQLVNRGIPFLAVDGDCVDQGSLPWGQVRTRLDSFQEVLEQAHE